MAIPAFMIITGYVYSLSLNGRGIKKIDDAYNLCIIRRRVCRYTIPLVVVLIWELVDVRHFNIISSMNLLEIVKWILQGTVGKGSYYYPVMIQIVFLFPVVFFIIERKKETGLWLCLGINIAYEVLSWAYSLNTECYRLLSFRYIFLIGVGVYIYQGYRFKRIVAMVLTLIGAVFITAISYLGYEPVILNSAWATTNCISSMLIVPFMAWILKNVHVNFKPLEIVGRASYHIFLTQMVYYRGYYYAVKRITWNMWIHLSIGILLCLIIGLLFYGLDSKVQKVANRMVMLF